MKASPRLAPAAESALAAAAFLALAALLRPVRGLPLYDDWAYAWSAARLASSGRLVLSDWTSPTLVLQAFWGALISAGGFSHGALRLSTVVLAAASIGLFHRLLRRGGAGRGAAALAAAGLAAYPPFLCLSLSFMTDVPFLALVLAAVALGERPLREGKGGLLPCGLALAAACLVRQTGLLAAFGLAAWARRRGTLAQRRAAALLAPPLAAWALSLAWLYGVHGVTWAHRMYNVRALLARALDPAAWILETPPRLGWAALHLGLAALPFGLPVLWDSELRTRALRSWREAPPAWRRGTAALVLLAAVLAAAAFPPPNALFSSSGLGYVWALGREAKAAGPLSSPAFWLALGLACALSFGVLCLAARRDAPAAAEPAAWAFLPLLLAALAGPHFTDRYLLVLAPVALAAAASRPPRGSFVVCGALLLLSFAGTLDSLNWHEAFWDGAKRLEGGGLGADEIEGSLEWVAWHGYQDAMDRLKAARPLTSIRDEDWFQDFQARRKAAVSFSKDLPPSLFERQGQVAYFCPLTLRTEYAYLYRLASPTQRP